MMAPKSIAALAASLACTACADLLTGSSLLAFAGGAAGFLLVDSATRLDELQSERGADEVEVALEQACFGLGVALLAMVALPAVVA